MKLACQIHKRCKIVCVLQPRQTNRKGIFLLFFSHFLSVFASAYICSFCRSLSLPTYVHFTCLRCFCLSVFSFCLSVFVSTYLHLFTLHALGVSVFRSFCLSVFSLYLSVFVSTYLHMFTLHALSLSICLLCCSYLCLIFLLRGSLSSSFFNSVSGPR
jgi:hypothetical protein